MPSTKSEPAVHLYHATAPTCWWSWGYEAILNRIPLVYGDRVKVHLLLGCVYEDLDDWMKAYEMTPAGQGKWAQEARQTMGVPIRTDYGGRQPRSMMPATLAVLAANRQGEDKGSRFMRAVLRRFCVEGEDVTQDDALRAAAEEASLDVDAFFRDYRDTDSRRHELEHQGHEFPHVPMGFYNLALTDGGDRTVILDYAFDPAIVDGAIDYLSGGRLRRANPTDALGYLREHGPAPLAEIARVLGVPQAEATSRLASLEKQGEVTSLTLAGEPHWTTMDPRVSRKRRAR